jgi:phosphatidate cytidylyltransferase
VLALVLAAPYQIIGLIVALVSVLGMREYTALVMGSSWDLEAMAGLMAAALVPIAALAGPFAGLAALGLSLPFLFAVSLIKGGDFDQLFDRLSKRCFGVLYIGGHLACLTLLIGLDHGRILAIFLIACVAAADVGAYYTGRFLGKHKLAPNLSPGKTIEGMAGGVLLACLVGGAYTAFFLAETGFIWGAGLGLVLALISVAGDLLESIIKRRAGAKDSGCLLPGHGGVLDRVDGLLLAMPALLLARFLLW